MGTDILQNSETPNRISVLKEKTQTAFYSLKIEPG
jgi:hypothetical protein